MKQDKKQIQVTLPIKIVDHCTRIAKEKHWRRCDVIWDYIELGMKYEKELQRQTKLNEMLTPVCKEFIDTNNSLKFEFEINKIIKTV